MQIQYFGPGDPLSLAFFNTTTGDSELQYTQFTGSSIRMRNPSNGVVTTFFGTDLPTSEQDLGGGNARGTLSGWTTTDAAGGRIANITDVAWPVLYSSAPSWTMSRLTCSAPLRICSACNPSRSIPDRPRMGRR